MAFDVMALHCVSQLSIGGALLGPLHGGQIFTGSVWKGLQLSGVKPEELTGETTIQRDRALLVQPHRLKARRTRP
jgi:hypothetical protein